MKRLIDSYCGYLKNQGIITETQVEVCSYGLELFVSGVLNIGIVLCISLILGHDTEAVLFLIGFIPMRLFAGGYHADTHFHCCIIFSGLYLLSTLLNLIRNTVTLGMFVVVEMIIIYLLAPVPSPNKPISERKRRKNRKISICIVLFNICIYMMFLLGERSSLLSVPYFIGGFLASCTLIAGRIKANLTVH